tara:strand:- start:3819 stop:4352 length:534 start_codon:yes stop_codon:yes gene_type:complete
MLTSNEIIELQQRFIMLHERLAVLEDPEEIQRVEDEMQEAFEALGESPDRKLLAIRAVVRRVDSEVTLVRDEIKLLQQAVKSRLNSIARLKDAAAKILEGHAEIHGETKMQLDGHTFWLANTWRLSTPENLVEWPEAWLKTETKVKGDTSLARSELKLGAKPPPGFELVRTQGIRWR